MRTRTCAYQGLKNGSFSENFANVLNERLLIAFSDKHSFLWSANYKVWVVLNPSQTDVPFL